MAKTKVLTNEQWVEIKNEFMLGKSANAIAKQFGVTHRTILLHAKKHNWNHGVLSSEMADITSAVASVINKIDGEQISGIEAKLMGILEMQKLVTSYTQAAIKLNLRNLNDVIAIDDVGERVKLTNIMKANMVDLASINAIVKDSSQNESKDTVINLIME